MAHTVNPKRPHALSGEAHARHTSPRQTIRKRLTKSRLGLATKVAAVLAEHTDDTAFAAATQHIVDGFADWCCIDASAGGVMQTVAFAPAIHSVGHFTAPSKSLNVPLRRADAVIGTLTVGRNFENAPFSPSEVLLFESLAPLLALALENRQLRILREEVLSIISHDLRNPLTAILISSSLLHERTVTPAPDQAGRLRKLSDSIRRSGDRLNLLIENLLDSVRLETGRLVLETGEHRTGGIIAEAWSLHAGTAAHRNSELVVDLESAPEEVRCDKPRIRRVLSILLDNALKASPPDSLLRCFVRQTSEATVFCVEDQGKGIAPELAPAVFGRYCRNRPESGVGKSLFVAKSIVEAHGGGMWFESRPKGTAFYFTLPG